MLGITEYRLPTIRAHPATDLPMAYRGPSVDALPMGVGPIWPRTARVDISYFV